MPPLRARPWGPFPVVGRPMADELGSSGSFSLDSAKLRGDLEHVLLHEWADFQGRLGDLLRQQFTRQEDRSPGFGEFRGCGRACDAHPSKRCLRAELALLIQVGVPHC